MRGPALKPEVTDTILRFARARVHLEIISEQTGVELDTVKRVIYRERDGALKFVQRRSHGYDAEIARRKAAGESYSRIAAAMGLCKSVVAKRVKAGLPGARQRPAAGSVEPPAPPPS